MVPIHTHTHPRAPRHPSTARHHRWSAVVAAAVLLSAVMIGGCASKPPASLPQAQNTPRQEETELLNMELAAAASRQSADTSAATSEYRIGPGDVLEIAVFQVDELNLTERVNGRGTIIVPLLGELKVAQKTAAEIEQTLAAQLGDKYLHDPQVGVFVTEYHSQKITVMGAVNEPAVHVVQRPRSVLELLSMSGGLNEKAGYRMYIQTINKNPETGNIEPQRLVVDIKQVLEMDNTGPLLNMILHGGDSIYVPKAGVVFVEGAVRKPGAYPMQGETDVLKAIAMAGGTEFDAKEGSIQVLRPDAKDNQVREVDIKAVRDNKVPDLTLADGDIVMVRSNAFKKGMYGVWRGISGIFSFGYNVTPVR